jgi:opine dehydrogenase
MTTIAVLGAGAGGAAATTELIQNGFDVRLWNRSVETLQPFIENNGIKYEGVLGEGTVVPDLISNNLEEVLEAADGILICMPTLAHGRLAGALAALGQSSLPVVLNPGHTGGAMEFHQTYAAQSVSPPPIAEFSTLTYVARKNSPEKVTITGVAKRVRVAGMAGDIIATDLAMRLYPIAAKCADVIATSLSNVNLVLHPPGCILAAAWVEATSGEFTFYVDGMTDGVGRVMQQLDNERRIVASAYGHELPALDDEMLAIGTIDQDSADLRLPERIRQGRANRSIKAPNSLQHRYYVEDFWYGLMPFMALADVANVPVPTARSLMTLAAALKSESESESLRGRTAQRMGVQGLGKKEIIDLVRGEK